jgi:hypothetical protein
LVVGHVIIPTDFHSIIFQRGRLKPPTSIISPFITIKSGNLDLNCIRLGFLIMLIGAGENMIHLLGF